MADLRLIPISLPSSPGEPITGIPDEVLDGAVVELGYTDGVLTADIRIPAHQP